jgi:serine/threonine protein kinase/Tfp pilus assembly protein PilF
MGEVYLAWDSDLERAVALKILPSAVASDQQRMQRFIQEAKAASALNHPNILTIYEIGESDSLRFIAMECIDGMTLSQHMSRTRMTVHEVLDVAIQVASALSAAHHAGIIHRDIKPDNIMLRPDGYVKVLDFGLAKLTQQQVNNAEGVTLMQTEPGLVMGTIQYMSPEQARGLVVDPRTDIWSLGVVLYQMLAGRAPFEGPTTSDIIVSLLDREPPPIEATRKVPVELAQIVTKALRKDTEERYQTAGEMTLELRNLKKELEFRDKLASGPSVARNGNIVDERAMIEASGNLMGVPFESPRTTLSQQRKGRSKNPRPITSLAILPLANAAADPNMEYLADGITESIINSLSQLPKVRVVPRNTVFRYKGQEVDLQQVCQSLKTQAVLTGRVRQLGDRLIIGVELIDATNESQLWGEQFNRRFTDIFEIQEEIARAVSEKLRLHLTGVDKKRLAKRYTEKTEAYQLFLKGRFYWNKRSEEALKKGIEYFQQAIEGDPGYALAYAGIADCYAVLYFFGDLLPKDCAPRAKATAIKALEIDHTLAEAHTSLALIKLTYEWDWPGAEREFKKGFRLNANYATSFDWYSVYLTSVGRFAEALAEIKKAQELDPLSLIINTGVGRQFYYARRYDETIEHCLKTLEMEPNFAPAHWFLGQAYVQKEKYQKGIAELQKAVKLSGGRNMMLASLGYAYAASGKRTEAQDVLNKLHDLSPGGYVSPISLAIIYAGLGEKDEAFAWLEKAYDERVGWLVFLVGEPKLDLLRSDARFADLTQRIGLVR